jgi:hypothetical protein
MAGASSPKRKSKRRRARLPRSPSPEERARRAEAAIWHVRRKEFTRRLMLPALGIVVVAVAGATRFVETRQTEAQIVALVLPVVAMLGAALTLRHAESRLRRAAFLLAFGLGASTEAILLPTVAGSGSPGFARSLGCALLLCLLGVGAAGIEALAARRGTSSRFGALAGMVVGLGLYLPRHFGHKDPFGAVVAALLVALFVGGGAGLMLGAIGRAWAGARL